MATVPGTGVILTLHGDSTGVILTFVLDDGIYAYNTDCEYPPRPLPPYNRATDHAKLPQPLGRCAWSMRRQRRLGIPARRLDARLCRDLLLHALLLLLLLSCHCRAGRIAVPRS